MSQCLSNLPISNMILMPERAISPRSIHLCNPVSRRTHSTTTTAIRAVTPSERRDNFKHQTTTGQQFRRRSPPVTGPVGMIDRFPTARTVQQMMETMERLMEDERLAYNNSRGGGGGVWWPSPQSTEESRVRGRGGRRPWDIKETEEEYKMRFDMPGMNKNDVKVWIEDKMLVVKAEKIPKNKDGDEDEDDEEWGAESYGRYSNRIVLPENVEFEKIGAEVKDGVLYITIPKSSPRSKVLDINVQ